MSRPHEPEHERLLESLFTDADDPRAESWTRVLADCAVCAPVLEDLRLLTSDLGRAGGEIRATWAEVQRLDDPEGDARMDALLGEALAADAAAESAPLGPESAGIPGWGRVAAGLAAAACLLLVLRVAWRSAPTDGDATTYDPSTAQEGPYVLGGSGDASDGGLVPAGEVESFDVEFRWDLELDDSYIVRVWPRMAGEERPNTDLEPLATSDEIDTNAWTWDPAELATWPDDVWWEVVTLDVEGFEGERAFAALRRSR